MTEATSLYRHYDAQGALLYVGMSLNAVGRLANHKSVAPWFRKINRVTIEHYASRKAALEAERLAILAEKPLYNVQFNAVVNPPPPRDCMVSITMRLDPELIQVVEAVAEAERRSVSSLVRNVVEDWARRQEQERAVGA